MQPKTYLTPAEYLAFEAESETKHEYWDGHVVAMAGAELSHVRVVSRFVTVLNSRLKGCEALPSDLRVRIPSSRYVYPDVVVICGDPELTQDRPSSLLNPTVIIEVTSESTSEVDRGAKLAAYTGIPSLKEYWIAEQTSPQITRYVRRGGDWLLHIEGGPGTVVRSEHLGIEFSLDEIYG